jgi:hypothetical protein
MIVSNSRRGLEQYYRQFYIFGEGLVVSTTAISEGISDKPVTRSSSISNVPLTCSLTTVPSLVRIFKNFIDDQNYEVVTGTM